jgi:hypothetical protein
MIDLELVLRGLLEDLSVLDAAFIVVLNKPFDNASVIMEIIKWLPQISYYGFAMYKLYKLMNNEHQYADISALLKSVGSALIELASESIKLQNEYFKYVGMDLKYYYWKLVSGIQSIKQPLLNLYYCDIKRVLHLFEILRIQSIKKRPREPTIRDCAPHSKRPRNK